MNLYIHRIGPAVLMMCALASTRASGQRILDWPLRTSAMPAVVVRGPEAAFSNPAAIQSGAGRGEVVVADQRTPDMIGISGFAAAASWRLDERTVVAAGYQHVSIDDIGETSTSPLPDGGEATFSITEDQIGVGVSHVLGAGVSAGAGGRYDRSNESGLNESTTSLGAGVVLTPLLELRPTLGVSVYTQNGGVRYAGGLEVGVPRIAADVAIRAAYGVRGGENMVAIEHRGGVTVSWKEFVTVTSGVATADAGSERSWEPVFGASLRVSRYELGILRETLASDFGAAYSFRFRFGLK